MTTRSESVRTEQSRREERIGIAVITHNRPGLFRECIGGIPRHDVCIVVNDGEPYPGSLYPSTLARVVQHSRTAGVSASKREAIAILLELECSHLFLCEDDVKVLDPDLSRAYIRASDQSGIRHLNFGFHGPRNKSRAGHPVSRLTVRYDEGVTLSLLRNIVGAFSYYRREVIDACGTFDTSFRNMLDHVEHSYRIIQRGFHPPFWWFADIENSHERIHDLDPQLRQSTLERNRLVTEFLFQRSNIRFRRKHGTFVGRIPDASEDRVRDALETLRVTYGRSRSLATQRPALTQ